MSRHQRIAVAGSTALVTGATGGIGQAITRRLAGSGAHVLVTGRRASELELLATSVDAQALVLDLARRDDVDRLAQAAITAGVDILVANAALPATGQLAELTAEEIDRMIDVNLRAPISLARQIIPSMLQRGRGHLVFVSSLSGKVASPASSMYSATKFGLRGFALGLREDLRTGGVGVSLVAPGFIRDAGMFADTGLTLPRGTGTRSPEDVADAVARVIERDLAELDVAPLPLRVGASIASVAPALAAFGSRLMGSERLSAAMADRQRDKR